MMPASSSPQAHPADPRADLEPREAAPVPTQVMPIAPLPEQVSRPWYGLDGLAQLIAAADACAYAKEKEAAADSATKDKVVKPRSAGIARAVAQEETAGLAFDLQPPPFLFRRACIPCASRKKRCDRFGPPCSSCKHRDVSKCIYPGTTIADSLEALRGVKRSYNESAESDGWSSPSAEEEDDHGSRSSKRSSSYEEDDREGGAMEDPEEEEYVPNGASARAASAGGRRTSHLRKKVRSSPTAASAPIPSVEAGFVRAGSPILPSSTSGDLLALSLADAALARERRACLACTGKKKGCDRMGPPCGTCKNSRHPESCSYPSVPSRHNTPSPVLNRLSPILSDPISVPASAITTTSSSSSSPPSLSCDVHEQ